jgi:hypothetical protein
MTKQEPGNFFGQSSDKMARDAQKELHRTIWPARPMFHSLAGESLKCDFLKNLVLPVTDE